ncbi:DUF2254 family protein [Sphingomonas glacialis]|uniref:DUF2254 domain-containing protein n=1 Tax=Sphingomonas glacialis TaxID=658225 RepID=A0A502FFM2_9SPHN|nr:DUF2254 family protein [Sphingomonas glacialis]TPG48032.1 DUF2254 domain-containing protein [Sphingomonas glacialis]
MRPNRFIERLRRSFSDFLTIPLVVVVGFLLLAFAAHAIDGNAGPRDDWGPAWRLLDRYVGDVDSANDLLKTLAGSLITVTSITFSILLLAVQQGASSLTSQVFDQYLQRRSNQAYFGFFVGASLYTVLTLVLTNSAHRPVLGTTVAIIVLALSLCALVTLIYTTVDQTRATSIIQSICSASLATREKQAKWLERTVEPPVEAMIATSVESRVNGFLRRIDMDALCRLTHDNPSLHIFVRPSLGDYLPFRGELACFWGGGRPASIEDTIRKALVIEEQRDLGCDAAYGVNQLAIIGWTSTSTAKSNPSAAKAACHALFELLWQWAMTDRLVPKRDSKSRIFYRDTVASDLFDGFESLIVAASESMQHQTLSTTLNSLVQAFPKLSAEHKARAESAFLLSLDGLGDHLPTELLTSSYQDVVAILSVDGRADGASRVEEAWRKFAATKGILHSRGNRE